MQKKSQNSKKAKFIFFKNNIKVANVKDIKILKKKLIKNKLNNRLCFHNKNNDKQQEMIVCQKKGMFFPPKKNTVSDQSFLILEGKLLIIIFDKIGKIKKKIILSRNDNIFARIKKNIYHCDIPLTKISIHLETKNCLFDNNTNRLAKFDFDLKKISEINR